MGDFRDDTSEARRIDIARLMRPRSIAIVGVSSERGSGGGGALENLERYGYGGEIHLVSRGRSAVRGRACVASIDDLPEGIDTALLMIPRAAIRLRWRPVRGEGLAPSSYSPPALRRRAVNGRPRRSALRRPRTPPASPCAVPTVSVSSTTSTAYR